MVAEILQQPDDRACGGNNQGRFERGRQVERFATGGAGTLYRLSHKK